MSASASSLPFDVKEVYGDHPVRDEGFRLSNESEKIPGVRSERVRLLTDFLFVKNGQLVMPHYQSCTKDFWEDLEVWGFMMSPTGGGKWLAWSLLWHLDWAEKHMELVRIRGIYGMSKEHHKHFRNGNQTALWVNTKEKCTYALMEPEEQIAIQWALVCESWRQSDPLKLSVPFCGPLSTLVSIPAWWHRGGKTAGKRAWQSLVAKQTKYENKLRQHDATPSPTPPAKGNKGKRKGHSTVPAKRKRERSSSRDSGSPERYGATRQVATRGSNRMSVKKGVEWCPTDDSESGSEKSASQGEDEAPPDVPDDHPWATSPRPLKCTGMLSVEELAAPSGPAAAVVSREKQASKDRLQREADPSYSPGPSTQKANTLPLLAPDGMDPVLVFVPASSSPVEQVASLSQPQASQGSHLAQHVRGMSLSHDNHEEGIGGNRKEAKGTDDTGTAGLEGVALRSGPGATRLERPEGAGSDSSPMGIPNASPRLTASPAPDSQALASTSPYGVLRTAPAASPAPPTAPGPVLQSLPAPAGPALAVEPPVVPTVASEPCHVVIPAPGSDKYATASLDNRSSRRHNRQGPA